MLLVDRLEAMLKFWKEDKGYLEERILLFDVDHEAELIAFTTAKIQTLNDCIFELERELKRN